MNPSLLSSKITTFDPWPVNTSYVPFILNEQGIGAITPLGITKFGVRTRHDIENFAPLCCDNWEFSLVSHPPYLKVQVQLPTAPAAPTNLTVNITSTSSVDLGWLDNSMNENGYQIERSLDGGVTYVQIATTSADITSNIDSGLVSAVMYYYRVRAFNSGGESAYSNIVSVLTLPPPPAAPTSFSANTLSSNAINLAWVDNSSIEDGFALERGVDGINFVQIATTSMNVVSLDNTDLSVATTYYYRVRAFNSGGVSAYSNVGNATTWPLPPAAPVNLSANAISYSSIFLSWIDNSTNENGYFLERGTDGVNFTQIATTIADAVSFGDSGLLSITKYYYRVRAFNSGGNSAYANVANATTLPTPPSTPTTLSVSAISSSAVDLSWIDNATNEDGNQIERSTNGVNYIQIATTSINTVNYSDTGLAASTTYYYRVRAFNAGGVSAYSNVGNATTLPLPPASPSDFVAAAISSSQIALAWTDNAINEDGYVIERSLDNVNWSAVATLAPNTIDYADSGLAAMTTYYYRIHAFNAGGVSASVSTFVTTLAIAPSAPSALEVNRTTNPINLATPKPAFTALFNDASSTALASSYEIQVLLGSTVYWDSGRKAYTNTTPVGSRTPLVTSGVLFPRDGASYTWRIKFWDQYGNEGEWSTELATFTMRQHP